MNRKKTKTKNAMSQKELAVAFERAAEAFARNWASSHGYELVPRDPIKDSPAYKM